MWGRGPHIFTVQGPIGLNPALSVSMRKVGQLTSFELRTIWNLQYAYYNVTGTQKSNVADQFLTTQA